MKWNKKMLEKQFDSAQTSNSQKETNFEGQFSWRLEPKEKLEKALANNEFRGYLLGYGVYNMQYHEFESIPLPTNVSRLVSGIYDLHREKPEIKIDKKLMAEIHDMLDGNLFNVFMALQIVSEQIYKEKNNYDSSFTLETEVLEHLESSLLKNKELFLASNGSDLHLRSDVSDIWSVVVRTYGNIYKYFNEK